MSRPKNKTLEDYRDIVEKCVKCGACQAHCPIYGEVLKEGAVARGKISLAASLLNKTGELSEERLQQDISLCLLCGSCVNKCPNKVPTDKIVAALRRRTTESQGLNRVAKTVSSVIGRPRLLTSLAKTGALFSPLFLKKLPATSGLRLRFPTPVMEKRTLPKLSLRNLFNRFPEFIHGEPTKPTVGIFAGCSLTYLYPEVGEMMINLLKDLGYSISLPRSQGCCGIPALSSGNGELVEELCQTNLQAFTTHPVDFIVTGCASCNGGIGEYYSSMEGQPTDFTSKVRDIHVFLKEQGVFEKFAQMEKWDTPTRVTYHDPCHLKSQGITSEPRELLQALPNVDFIEMEESDLCCGLGGTFSVYHYDHSKNIGSRKIPGLKESKAELIATACPGCILQLQDTINHADMTTRAVHIMELVHEALQQPKG